MEATAKMVAKNVNKKLANPIEVNDDKNQNHLKQIEWNLSRKWLTNNDFSGENYKIWKKGKMPELCRRST